MLANRTSPVVRPLILAMALALGTAHAAEPGSDDAEVHALLQQLSQRLEQQEAEIKRLRGQVHELEMSQRRRFRRRAGGDHAGRAAGTAR